MSIEIVDITNGSVINNEWTGSGIFDVLIKAVNKNIEIQCDSGRITAAEYGSLYSQAIQAVLAQSIEYVMRKDFTIAQIEGLEKDAELKTYELVNIKPKELEIMDKEILIKEKELELKTTESNRVRDTTEAELEKQWGYSVTRDINDELVLGATTGTGAIDKELELKTKQISVMEKEILLKDAQKSLAYTERVGKDKEVASMGLDNVLKLREADRVNSSTYVYQPAYEG